MRWSAVWPALSLSLQCMPALCYISCVGHFVRIPRISERLACGRGREKARAPIRQEFTLTPGGHEAFASLPRVTSMSGDFE